MRITKTDLQRTLNWLIRLTKNEKLELEYNASYGGYIIVEIGEKGAERHLYGNIRMKGKEMYYALNMVCCALEEEKRRLLWMDK
jgi:hypothetical protein